jgi:hypothetical protein
VQILSFVDERTNKQKGEMAELVVRRVFEELEESQVR